MREAAGFILFTGSGADRRFLLLRNARHGTWSFPKGHLERGESPRAGARRELAEETGILAVREVPGFVRVHDYTVDEGAREPGKPGYAKRVHLFLAEAEDAAWVRSDEHDEGGWLRPDEVRRLLAFPALRDAFEAALDVLGGDS